MLAAETGCLGLELRRVGESFGGGAVMYALRRLLLLGVEIWLGGGLREDEVEFLTRAAGVVDCFVGVFAAAIGCRVIRTAFAGRLAGAGEFDLVDTGLLGAGGLVTFLTERGSREEGPGCGGIGGAAASLRVLVWFVGMLDPVCCGPVPLGDGTLRYQSCGDGGWASAFASDGKRGRVGLCRLDSDVLLGRTPSMP